MSFSMDTVSIEYLSDVFDERVFYHTQGWGELGINTAVKPTDGRAPMPLRIRDKTYEKGLGHHAPGEIEIDLNGVYEAFEAEVGIQWQGGKTNGTVVFQVFVDDDKKFDSGIVKEQDAARPVRVDVRGAASLRLVVTDAGDGIMCDCADWADARLTKAPGAAPKPAGEAFDIARFARVATWDPHRDDGARSNRVQEFRREDVYLETPVKPARGVYEVPVAVDGTGCLGLQWAETRLLRSLGLEFPDDDTVPATEGVQVQFWTGESPWQGKWKPLTGKIVREGRRWTLAIATKDNLDFPRTGVDKIRWIFPRTSQPIFVKMLSAYSRSRWDTAELRLEFEKPETRRPGSVEVYNGAILSDAGEMALERTWDFSAPLRLNVRYSRPKPWKSDRTVLRILAPDGACGVAVEDVLANGCVYVPALGLYVAPESNAMSAAEYRKSIEGRKTVLERVREMPDQTLAQALEKTHNPAQNNGPTMLSLACDNHKFVAYGDGAIQFEPFGEEIKDGKGLALPSHRLAPRFGAGKSGNIRRELKEDWFPAPVVTVHESDVVYRECAFVVPAGDPVPTSPLWLNTRPLCVVEFTIENGGEKPAAAALTFQVDGEKKTFPADKAEQGGLFSYAGKLLVYIDARDAGPLTCTVDEKAVTVSAMLSARATARCYAFLPGWKVAAQDYAPPATPDRLWEDFKAYWRQVMADAAQIEIPDRLLTNVIRASQAHCLIAARNEQDGTNVAAWIASDRYGPLESEAHSLILGMTMMGQRAFAQRSLDFFIKRYSPPGYLTTGYTLMGTGWHLWTLARHHALTQDAAWFNRVAPEVARVCRWIAQQREKTKRDGADLEQTPEYGLVPPGVGADWNRFAYRFAIQAHYYAGLHDAAAALANIGHAGAAVLLGHAEEFRNDILRAYHWNQARTPVLPMPEGTWVPAYGGMLGCFGATGEMIPGEDGNRSWAYDVELGAHHLIPLGVIDADSLEAARMMDHMEDVWFLHAGMGDYPEDKNHADWFNQGGFSKVQPYYTRNAEIDALRDDVKPFIRSYFNAIASLLNLENLSFWEHFHNQGAWNKTHETGWFLVQSRTMLVTERGDDLWLAPFVTCDWLRDGNVIAVRNAPTAFGPVSYRIASSVAKGYIEARIEPPTRKPPKRLTIRLRHPEGLPMRSVLVNDADHKGFDPARECVYIDSPAGPVTISAEF
jgi:hypothetical protein